MIVEVLQFSVQAGMRDAFVERNERVWTPALRRQPGFLSHEVLLSRTDPEEVVILVRWRTVEDLRAFPEELEKELDRRMADLGLHHDRRVYERADTTEQAT